MFVEFLETYPLYRKCVITLEVAGASQVLPTPPLQLHCNTCASERTFEAHFPVWIDLSTHDSHAAIGSVGSNVYHCANCKKWAWHFILYVIERHVEGERFEEPKAQIMKIGQSPAWDITPDKVVSKWLGDYDVFYRKGLMCESQGYGIGAFSYYRRVVEDIIDQLLQSIADVIDPDEQEHYAQELARIRALHNAMDKIVVVKDLLPPILKPGGWNPLDVLHGTLSEGLHKLSEDECMNLAAQVRTVLVFLVRQVLEAKDSAKQYKDTLDKLLKRPRND